MTNSSARSSPYPWWFDYGTAEVVRRSDGKRWRVEDVALMCVKGAIDVDAVDRWVVSQPEDR